MKCIIVRYDEPLGRTDIVYTHKNKFIVMCPHNHTGDKHAKH